MSYSHDQKRKIIRRFKRMWGSYGEDKWYQWYPHYQEYATEEKRKLQGELIGTLEDILRRRSHEI